MNSSPDQSFPSKLLLFGEYAIIKGGQGLAIPFDKFSGKLEIGSCQTDKKFFDLYRYLSKSPLLAERLNLEQLKSDLDLGLKFSSNIPQGYGLGSSGALCAAIFSKYSYFEKKDSYTSLELKQLQDYMALMESFYHGTSSGLDCLISLIDKAVHIKERKDVVTIDCPDLSNVGHFYLLDSGTQRKTSPFVHQFIAKYEADLNFQKDFEMFKTVSDEIIKVFLKSSGGEFQEMFKELSSLQIACLKEMIPASVEDFWQAGLKSKQYYTKLCGAGGGGFFLVYSPKRLSTSGLIEL